jgi:hypothetical protein
VNLLTTPSKPNSCYMILAKSLQITSIYYLMRRRIGEIGIVLSETDCSFVDRIRWIVNEMESFSCRLFGLDFGCHRVEMRGYIIWGTGTRKSFKSKRVNDVLNTTNMCECIRRRKRGVAEENSENIFLQRIIYKNSSRRLALDFPSPNRISLLGIPFRGVGGGFAPMFDIFHKIRSAVKAVQRTSFYFLFI